MGAATYTSIASAPFAGFYHQGGIEMTCILKEGNITVSSGLHSVLGKNVKNYQFSFASEISKGDFVMISADTANTYTATGGVPVVTLLASATPITGIVMAEPSRIHDIPTSNQTTWSTMLSSGYYRTARVWLFCTDILDVLTPEAGSSAIAPGYSVIYDHSANGFVLGRQANDFADSSVYDGSGADTGATGFLAEPIALHYSASNTARVLIMLNWTPVRSAA